MHSFRTSSLSVAFVAVVCLASVLLTQAVRAETICDHLPPAEYAVSRSEASAFIDADGPHWLPKSDLAPACGPFAMLGCYDPATDTVYATDIRFDPHRSVCLIQHELGHRKGWRH